ncbi:MAG: hypothetical protein L0229_20240 [Blastocatellia bacterium]|nr:hypothetical protein [Blastocatellia bacterium]
MPGVRDKIIIDGRRLVAELQIADELTAEALKLAGGESQLLADSDYQQAEADFAAFCTAFYSALQEWNDDLKATIESKISQQD